MNGNTWRYVSGALALFVVCMGAMWGMVGVHASHAHDDALARREFTVFQKALEKRLDRFETKLDMALKD